MVIPIPASIHNLVPFKYEFPFTGEFNEGIVYLKSVL